MSNNHNQIPDVVDVLLGTALYEKIKLPIISRAMLEDILVKFRGPFDCWCQECQSNSTFRRYENLSIHDRVNHPNSNNLPKLTLFAFYCTRDTKHLISFLFRIENEGIEKVGQYPSMADVSYGNLKRYSKVLDTPLFSEFKRAIGLHAHGIGVGSFVYLRRIIENLLEESHQSALIDNGWDETRYRDSAIVDKIKMLHLHLPQFLSDHPMLYSILSKGIHELSEEECLEYFPVMRASIELILDQKLEALERKKKTEEAKNALNAIHSKAKQNTK